MGISVGVTYSTARGTYEIYPENEMERLGEELVRADLVVGWNHLQFDYPVLQPYVFHTLAEQTLNLDMMLELETMLGFRLKLDSVASASLGTGKTADGLDALRWWQEHKKTGDFAPAAQNRRILRLRRQGHQVRPRIRPAARDSQIRRQERPNRRSCRELEIASNQRASEQSEQSGNFGHRPTKGQDEGNDEYPDAAFNGGACHGRAFYRLRLITQGKCQRSGANFPAFPEPSGQKRARSMFPWTGHIPGDDLLSQDLSSHYHWRCGVSLPGSEWDRVVPPRSGHQRAILGSNGGCHCIPKLGLWGPEVVNVEF